jgi:predicted AAA+ superfamily ATPase
MYIQRDINQRLESNRSPVQLLLGPCQCGKSTLLLQLAAEDVTELSFDDLQLRHLANTQPQLFLQQFTPPLLLDEVQYAPNLFAVIKQYVDKKKFARLTSKEKLETWFRLTGSNQILMDDNVKESLAGRASYFYLNTLTVHELTAALPELSVTEKLFRGGWPELYIHDEPLSLVQYLNDYIRSYIEKDIVLSAGVQKQDAFNIVLGLLASRTGILLEYENIAKNSDVKAVTIKVWVNLLQRTALVYRLKPYSSNLNKHLIRSPKFYFLDTGLAVRLQGWQQQ